MRKKGILFLLFFVGYNSIIIAQVSDLASNTREIDSNPVAEIEVTTGLLHSEEYSNYLHDFAKTKNNAPVIRDYSIGTTDTFFVRNILNQDEWFEREAKLINVGNKYAIWLDSELHDQLSGSPELDHINQGLNKYLNESTDPLSIDPSLGVIEILENYVGDYPNSDGDGIIDILYLDIIDQFESSGQYVAGFFDPVNLSLYEYSNRRDMVYMDVYPTLIENDSVQLKRSISTLVHELQHLIHAGYEGDKPEEVFVNEGFSEAVEILCGFEPRNPLPYLSDTPKPLLSWDYSNPISDYSRASLWTQYLVEQFGTSILKELIRNKEVGIAGYEQSIQKFGGSGFKDSFQNWGIAVAINDLSISEKYGFNHPLLKNLTMSASGISESIPNVITGFLPANSHSLVSVPYVKSLKIEAGNTHDHTINLTSLIHYPDTGFEHVLPITNNVNQIPADSYNYGSISILLSNQSNENDTLLSPVNLFIDGERSSSARTITYGDGINDTFYSNASYLSLSKIDHKIGLIIPKQTSGYWLKNVTLRAVFDSELVGNESIQNKERDFLISFYRIKNSEITNPILSGIKLESKREHAKLVPEEFSLERYYSTLSIISDTIAIVIENDSDDENFISVGLDFSESENGIINTSSHWQALGDINIGGNSLLGFTPNISVDIIEDGHLLESGNLITSIKYDYSKVHVEIESPVGLEGPEVTLITKLPDGDYQKYTPVYSEDEEHSFEVPVQVNGTYSFKGVIQPGNSATTITDEMEWTIDIPNGFQLGQNYPNPFNPTTTIPFTLLELADVGWEIYDVLGRNVLSLEPTLTQGGEHTIAFDLRNHSSGIYFVRAVIRRERTGTSYTKPIKMLMIK